MGTAGAKAFGDMLLGNKTIQTLDVSDNSFGKPVVGDQVKLKRSGEMKIVSGFSAGSGESIKFEGSKSHSKADKYGNIKPSEFEWESQIPALCAGVAASQSLTSVSTTFRHALAVISHSSLTSTMSFPSPHIFLG